LDVDGAMEAYNQVLAIDPDSSDVTWNLAVIHHEFLQDFEAALQYYEKYATLMAADPEAAALARQKIEKVEADKGALAEAQRLAEEQRLREEEQRKQLETAKAPLLAKIEEAEKLIKASEGKASDASMEELQMAIDQSYQILEFEDVDLMGEIFEYLKATVEQFQAQNPS